MNYEAEEVPPGGEGQPADWPDHYNPERSENSEYFFMIFGAL